MHFYNFSKDPGRGRWGAMVRNALFVIAFLAYLAILVFIIQYFS